MEYKIAITGQEDAFKKKLKEEFHIADHKILMKREETDILVYIINPPLCTASDYDGLLKAYDEYALQLLRTTEEYLPFMSKGKKRICFITTTHSSINATTDHTHWERIVAASCNMAIKTLFNRLNPMGFTFRVFCLEDFKDLSNASYAVDYILQDRSMEEESHQHSDEKRIVMRDKFQRELPW